ncbi:winged helix-turn-helix transcriptional regulator [Pseudophaeobacter sp.]|uniref:winged helix-turn-helix transcriptional regulator n=1 Tax=Pseudophaeobacter sp. TaxID=1971739 RepID=UPI00329963CD
MPILSCLHDKVPGRQAALLATTGAGRGAFTASMQHLIQIGLVERNPGHGHPLRPEFRLTQSGSDAAATASLLLKAAEAEDQVLLRRAWTLPILAALSVPCYFGEIKKYLPKITDRALSQSLQLLEGQGWVERSVSAADRPPRPVYCAINTGARISLVASKQISFSPQEE